jgi:post-segregation antitoxin (ccd killing protein)
MPVLDEQALNTYMAAVDAEAQAVVCSRHVSGFAAEFERAYQAWRKANAEALSQGSALAEARGMNSPNGPSLSKFASMRAQLVEQLPADDRQRRCNELLAKFVEGAAK